MKMRGWGLTHEHLTVALSQADSVTVEHKSGCNLVGSDCFILSCVSHSGFGRGYKTLARDFRYQCPEGLSRQHELRKLGRIGLFYKQDVAVG